MLRLIRAAGFLVATAVCAFSLAQETQPASNAEHLKAKVTGVEGMVQVRSAEGQAWQKATVGMEVGEDAEFRTGPKSAVRFAIPPDQTITLDRLGTVKVLQAVNDNGKLKTQLGMRYGRTRYDIEAAGREHESSIATPSSTLAVRGTKVSVYDQRPFPAQAVSLTGRAEFRDFKKRVFFGGKGAGKTVVNVQDANAPAAALGLSTVDPGARLARSAAEEQLVNTLLSSGATISFDFDKGIKVIRGGEVPRTDQQLIPTLPGTLNFVLRWEGNTDLNLGVLASNSISPGGETLYPIAGSDSTPSGGRIAFDHRGGAHGGIEVGFWPTAVPGEYAFGSQYISGTAPTQATLDVFRDGKRVTFIGPDGNPTTSASYSAGPIPIEFGTGQLAGTLHISAPSASKVMSKPAKR